MHKRMRARAHTHTRMHHACMHACIRLTHACSVSSEGSALVATLARGLGAALRELEGSEERLLVEGQRADAEEQAARGGSQAGELSARGGSQFSEFLGRALRLSGSDLAEFS